LRTKWSAGRADVLARLGGVKKSQPGSMPRPTTCLFVRIPFTALARHPEAHCADRGKSTSASTASQSKKSLDRNCNLIPLEGYQKFQFKRFRRAISNSIFVNFSVLNKSLQLVVDRI
jgi:hypothetical protein